MSESERWHVAQYTNGEMVGHKVYTGYGEALYNLLRRGLLGGVNVLTRTSHCECRGRLS